MPKLTDQDLDLLTLIDAAGPEGITPEGIATNASTMGVRITRETALKTCRALARRGLVELRGLGPALRVYVTERGSKAAVS